MYKIMKAIKDLNHFSECAGISEILRDLRSIIVPPPFFSSFFNRFGKDMPVLIQSRKSLLLILSEKKDDFVVKNGVYLKDALHNALLVLAELCPLNEEDPITHHAILPSNKVFVSTGHQYDIYELINYHNRRTPRTAEKEERRNHKKLFNPLTNQPFSSQDSSHIQMVAQQKKITIEWLVDKNRGSARALAAMIKTRVEHLSIDELMDYLQEAPEKLINQTLVYAAEIINSPGARDLFLLLVAFSSVGAVMSGYILDHIVLDLANIMQPSYQHSRMGFLEAGLALAGLMSIGGLFMKYRLAKVNFDASLEMEYRELETPTGYKESFKFGINIKPS